MRLKFQILLTGCAMLSATTAPANLVFLLTPAALSGVGSNEVFFASALTNANLTTNLYLNDLHWSFNGTATNYLTADTNVFFANVPGVWLTNQTYTDVVFGVAINPSAPPGDYSGSVAILGGTNIFATNNLASQTFHVLLSPATLRLTASRTNCVLSWPSPPAGFVLQQCSDLTGKNWTAVTNATTVSNGWQKVVTSSVRGSYFYRLAYP